MAPKRKIATSAPKARARSASSFRRETSRPLPEGEWLALIDGRVVAHASTYMKIDVIVRELGLESRVILSRVLPKGPVIY
jgi:hypothetical protein